MSAYLGRRGFEQLRRQLSERDLAVIHSVQEHRFLTARQIEELHFADHATELAGARVCRRVLARLNKERLLIRLSRRLGGVRAGSSSFVYAVGTVGSRLLDHGRRFTEPSALFLDHTLAVAEAHLQLIRAARVGALELVRVEIEPVCWRRYIRPSGASEIVRPDLYVVTGWGDVEECCWALEIDRGTESPAALTRKCRAYETYWRSGREQEARGTFPLVVWVALDEGRERQIKRIIGAVRNLKRELFRVTSDEGLAGLLAGGAG
ncbi:MAG: replication-relaxation family protein [Gaiellaceae bacterium]